MYNAIFNNILVISWWSVLLIEEIGAPGENHQSTCRKSLTNFITYRGIEYNSPWTGFEFTILVVIGIDCTGSYKSNYHTITTLEFWKHLRKSNILSRMRSSGVHLLFVLLFIEDIDIKRGGLKSNEWICYTEHKSPRIKSNYFE